MFTAQSLLKAKIDLYNITANLAGKDYIQANYKNGKRKSKKHIPYSLSGETEQAKELYNLVYGKEPEDITQEQEETIKGNLLKYRLLYSELLQGNQGQEYYKNSIAELQKESIII